MNAFPFLLQFQSPTLFKTLVFPCSTPMPSSFICKACFAAYKTINLLILCQFWSETGQASLKGRKDATSARKWWRPDKSLRHLNSLIIQRGNWGPRGGWDRWQVTELGYIQVPESQSSVTSLLHSIWSLLRTKVTVCFYHERFAYFGISFQLQDQKLKSETNKEEKGPPASVSPCFLIKCQWPHFSLSWLTPSCGLAWLKEESWICELWQKVGTSSHSTDI